MKKLCCSFCSKTNISILFSAILFFIPLKTLPQSDYEIEQLFMDAESWFYFQDYQTALPLYIQVQEEYPENDNLNYKIGICYLNIKGQKQKAISYLNKASQNVTFRYTRESLYEEKAPVDAIFYLGNAYLINNQLDKALNAYNRFKDKLKEKPKITLRNLEYDLDYLEKQKQACRNAKKMLDKPVSFTARNLGNPVNTPQSEYNPVVSGDGETLIFTGEKKFYTGIFMVKKKNGEWGAPVNLLPQLGIDGDCETTSLSYDGTELYLYREDDLDGNLYVSNYRGGKWTEIEKLGNNINTEYWESHGFIGPKGEKLYFTSNREGGFGGLDIYVSERNADGSWGTAENLGPAINTEWQEDTPFLTPEGERLFFSSEGHYNMGGLDVFVANKTPSGWTKPKNLGYPINTTDDDRFFVPLKGGNQGFYARYHNNPPGSHDIFRYKIDHLNRIDHINVEGIMTYASPEENSKQDFHINILNTLTNDTLAILKPDSRQNRYNYTLDEERNHLIFETPLLNNNEQYLISRNFNIKERFLATSEDKEKEDKQPTNKPDSPPEINLEQKVFTLETGKDQLKIKLNLKGGNKLVVNTFKKNQLLNTEEFTIEQKEFIYQYNPSPNETKLSFKLVDDNNNLQSKTVNIDLDSLRLAQRQEEDTSKLQIQDRAFTFEDGNKKINIKLSLKDGYRLSVSTFVDNKLINKEEFDIEKDFFTYEFEPQDEKSKLEFRMVDNDGNIHTKSIVISNKPINQDLDRLLASTQQFKGNSLNNYLSNYGPGNFNFWEFMANLKADGNLDKESDILLYSLLLRGNDSLEEFYNDLLNLSEGIFKKYMKALDLSTIDSKEELIKKMLSDASVNPYAQQEVKDLFIKYIQDKYPEKELYKMALNISELDLDKILAPLDASAIDIVSLADLTDYLEKHQPVEYPDILAFLKGTELYEEPLKPGKSLVQRADGGKEEQPQSREKFYIPGAILGGVLLILIALIILKRKRKVKEKV